MAPFTQAAAAAAAGPTLELGLLEQALEQANALASKLRESGNIFVLYQLRATQARALLERGIDAREPAAEAMRLARETDDPLPVSIASGAAARL